MTHTSIQKLESLIEGNSAEDSGDSLPDLLRGVAAELRTHLQGGAASSASAVTAAVGLLRKLSGTENAPTRIECLISAAHYFYIAGQSLSAVGPATDAVALSEATSLKALLRKSLNILGIVYADSGNMSRAIECYARVLDLVHELGELEAECAVWVNLGVALMYCAQYREAIACYEHAIDITERDSKLLQYKTTALGNIALCSLYLEDYSRGLKAAESSVRESQEPQSAAEMVSRVLRENNYSRLLLEVGSVERATERCAIARRYADKSRSIRAEISASIAEGLCEVHAGHVDIGLSRLTATLEKARLLRSMLRDALAALVKAYELAGQPQRALVYLREMMEATRQTQQENALAHLRLHLESLGRATEGTSSVAASLERREAALRGKIAEQELFRSRVEMLERLAVTAELRDDSTGEHSYRVGKLASLLAAEYGCDEETCFMIDLAARLHDIGKIGVPDAILLKPERLNEAELQIMRTHTTVGADLLTKSNIPHMQMAEEIARAHHEWLDGSGYPGNLSGNAIPLAARITALADVFDALTHKRPYKEAWPIDTALNEIARLKGSQFDRELTDLFLVLVPNLRTQHHDLDAFLGFAAHSSPFLQARSHIWETLRKHKATDSTSSGSRLDLQR